jgi:hypothetical protein
VALTPVAALRPETFPGVAAKNVLKEFTMRCIVCLCLLALLIAASPARAQPSSAPENTRDVLLAGWIHLGEKVVKLADEFPEDKYDYKPVDTVRSFADVLRHVAFWNEYVAKAARGEKPDGRQNELPKAQFATKAAIVAALKSSLAMAASELRSSSPAPEPRATGLWMSFISHSSEHYGQLVVYFRMNGLVPPETRASGGN